VDHRNTVNDTSVAANLAFVAGAAAPIDVARVLAAQGPQRGCSIITCCSRGSMRAAK
jgi:hypothetical protein